MTHKNMHCDGQRPPANTPRASRFKHPAPHRLMLSIAAAALSACGGGDADPAAATSASVTSADDMASAMAVVAASPASSAAASRTTLVVRARGTPTQGTWPAMVVRVDGVTGSPLVTSVRANGYTDYSVNVPAPRSGSVVDVVFTNDGNSRTEDRNLFVESITVAGKTYPANGSNVVLDKGVGAAAFDGLNRIPGQSAVYWNGALRFTLPTVSAASGPTISGCEMFPATAVFNTRIDSLPVHPDNTLWMQGGTRTVPGTGVTQTVYSLSPATRRFHADFGTSEDSTLVDGYYGIPYNVVDGTAATTLWPRISFDAQDSRDGWTGTTEESDCAMAVDSSSDHGHQIRAGCDTLTSEQRRFPIPLDSMLKVEGGSNGGDHHLLTVEAGSCRLWEAYYAYKNNGVWSTLSTAAWDLKSNAMRPDGWTSTDAAGLPVLPLLLRADEASSGEIKHALRVTFQNSRMRSSWRHNWDGAYVWPARHAAGGGGDIPFGSLLRLRSGFVIPGHWTVQAKAVAVAMQRYGLYVADNGSNFYVQGEPSVKWDPATIEQLQTLALDQLEFVDTTPITSHPKFSPNAYQAQW